VDLLEGPGAVGCGGLDQVVVVVLVVVVGHLPGLVVGGSVPVGCGTVVSGGPVEDGSLVGGGSVVGGQQQPDVVGGSVVGGVVVVGGQVDGGVGSVVVGQQQPPPSMAVKSSALASRSPPGPLPPLTRTLPSGRAVAVCPARASAGAAVASHASVVGS
jgi:hypothetical protein